MAKPIKTIVKLQIPGGTATPAPPVGPSLAQHGINIGEFIKQFNEATQDKKGTIIPVEITIYEDRSFAFKLKSPPASDFLKKAAGIEKGSANPLSQKAGKVTKSQIQEIAKQKLEDLNTDDLEKAAKIIEGTAKQMGIEVAD
ncbi:MAG: 50S ribosomal protein L11 [Candidatus Niyogibacteria bacterium RIFCSPLOWO2_12_FULL_41_13]|uniref:Large ribosomal subunit protein uL11 n=1 Tax=Candidatus Niyogibacteria bacterium RIFCSPLOWO2_12_FULL_41_13 TaxID=1801726 RepID=A0A1G2F3P0_9BACT|nr:MAG: 50S ribosomal protein L11 [Candidatus Niyogibacteria bacterium RIFCSPLOWO2_12_FULL_41_13]